MFRLFDIMAFQHVSGISVNYDKNIWKRQSMCSEIVLKFQVSQKDIFSNSICPGLMDN